MEKTFRRYPIGIQDFEQLRNNNCIYIDKTDLIFRCHYVYCLLPESSPLAKARVFCYLRRKPIILSPVYPPILVLKPYVAKISLHRCCTSFEGACILYPFGL